ncbi:MAG: type IV pilus assembly protein PilM [Thermodesulfobacteriota bacterium]|nr:type IV pilus assembly protein PilM [Thermodesulfobacteriota bacterium]
MFNFLHSSKSCIGLDIGSHTVKAVQLIKKGASVPHVTSMGMAEIDTNIEQSGESTVSAVKSVLKDCDFQKTRLVTSLGGGLIIIKQTSLPISSHKEIEAYLKWEGSQYITLPMDSVVIKFQPRYLSSDKKSTEVLLVAADKNLFENHINFLSQIQLKPEVVDVNPLALANAYLALNPDNEDRNIVMLEVGAATTILNIFRKGGFFFTRDLSIAGNKFTLEVQNSRKVDSFLPELSIDDIDFYQAEIHKREETLDLDIIKAVLNKLLLEIRQSLLFYDNKTGGRGFKEIILTGGGANLPGLSSFLSENLSIPITYFNPLEYVQIDNKIADDDLINKGTQFAIAVGLALRG